MNEKRKKTTSKANQYFLKCRHRKTFLVIEIVGSAAAAMSESILLHHYGRFGKHKLCVFLSVAIYFQAFDPVWKCAISSVLVDVQVSLKKSSVLERVKETTRARLCCLEMNGACPRPRILMQTTVVIRIYYRMTFSMKNQLTIATNESKGSESDVTSSVFSILARRDGDEHCWRTERHTHTHITTDCFYVFKLLTRHWSRTIPFSFRSLKLMFEWFMLLFLYAALCCLCCCLACDAKFFNTIPNIQHFILCLLLSVLSRRQPVDWQYRC